jgi:N-acetylglucosaminyldiphosphoundecaprenol N-acetyl-beta-D-mannosaminyltransferase
VGDASHANARATIDGEPLRSLDLGPLRVDVVTMREAVVAIDELVASGRGGTVFTPNIDHVVVADQDRAFREAYARASLSLADGFPIVVTSKLTKSPLPEKVSGSDLVAPLMEHAAKVGRRVFLFGGGEGVAEAASRALCARYPELQIVGTAAPFIDLKMSDAELRTLMAPIAETRAEFVLVALGAPKQELLMDRMARHFRPAVFLGIGASLDFVSGRVRRAPAWMSRVGLEWLFRLNQERGRLWRRYLRDTQYPWIVLKHHLANRRSSTS